MRIRRWHVDGFGILHDYQGGSLPDGLILVHGPNEAGKSTLLAFLRHVLFGVPDRRSEAQYPPLRGGRHGGTLWLEGEDGLYRVERAGGRRAPVSIVRPDGSAGNDIDLRALLGHADASLFRSIFAFSLNELASMETLSSDEVRARIFTAGIAGAGRSAREVITALDGEASALLSPRSGRIRELLRDAQLLRQQAQEASRRASEYPELLEEEERARTAAVAVRGELAEAEAACARLGKLVELWPTELELQTARRELDALPIVLAFPPDPEERLATARTACESLGTAAAAADNELRQLRERRGRLVPDPVLAQVAPDVEVLIADLNAQRARLTQATSHRGQLRSRNAELEALLREMGPTWTEERLASFDVSLPVTEDVRARQRQREQAAAAAEQAVRSLEEFNAQVERVDALVEQAGTDVGAVCLQPSAERMGRLFGRLAALDEQAALVDGRSAGGAVDRTEADLALDSLASAEQERRRLAELLAQAEGRAGDIRTDPLLGALVDEVAEASRHVEVQRQRLRDLEREAGTLRDRQAAVDKALLELNPGWTEADAEAIQCDFATVQQIRQFGDRLGAAHEDTEGSRRELDHVRRGLSGREKDVERMERSLGARTPVAAAELDRQAGFLRRLRTRLSELAAVEAERRAEERARDDQRVLLGAQATAWPSWATSVGLGGAAALSVAAAWRFLAHDVSGGAALGAAAVLIAVLVLALRVASAGRAMAGAPSAEPAAPGGVHERLEALGRRATELRRRIADDAATLHLPDLPTSDQLEDRQEQWSRDHDVRRAYDELAAEIVGRKQEIESWRQSEAARLAQYDADVRREQEVGTEWNDWKCAAGLPADVTPATALDFLQQVRVIRKSIDDRDTAAAQLDRLRAEAGEWERRARDLVVRGGAAAADSASSSSVLDALLELQRRCADDAVTRREAIRLATEIEDWRAKLVVAEVALRDAEQRASSVAREVFGRTAGTWRGRCVWRETRRTDWERAIEARVAAEEEWAAFLASHGFEGPMSPEGVLDFFDLIRRARDVVVRRDEERDALEAVDTAVERWQERAERVLAVAGRNVVADAPADAWQDAVLELSRRCKEEAEVAREAAELDVAIERACAAQTQAREDLERAQHAEATLLQEAGAATEAEFRERLAVFRKRAALLERTRELEARIEAVIGRGDDAGALRAELRTGRVNEWEAQRASASGRVEQLQACHEDAIRRHHDLSNSRKALEEACDVADLELRLQAVRTELDAAIRRWKVVRVARALVDATLREFERTKQPYVLATASGFFSRVTEGRYPTIVQAEEPGEVCVLDRLGARRPVEQLSRGTQEQLYVCLRLGLAREFARREVALPLVMDDVLVNFDSGRAEQMARELRAFAEEQQVLLFTCHAFTKELLLDLDSGIRVIELPRIDIAPGPDATVAVRQEAEIESPTSDFRSADLEALILDALRAEPQAMSELAARLHCPAERLRPVLSELREAGRITMIGRKRAARYALAGGIAV